MFIHGFATGPAIWQKQIEDFSGELKVFTDPEKIDRSDDLFLVGWSMGGWKALDLWKEHHFQIKGIILVSAFAKYTRSDDYPCGTPLALLRKLEGKFMAGHKKGMEYFYDLIFKDKSQHYLIDRLPAPGKEDVVKWFDKLRNEDKRAILPSVDVPALIIQGARDPIVSAGAAEYLKENIKNSELYVFPGVGHAPFLEKTTDFNRRLREFVNKHGGQ